MSFLFPSARVSSSPEEVWTTAFHELGQRIRRHFVRSEPYYRALTYVQGLMSPVERKNGGSYTALVKGRKLVLAFIEER